MTLVQLYRPAWLFTWATVAGMVLLAIFPSLVTFLPQLFK